ANDQIKQIKKKNHLVRAIKQALEYLLSGNNPVQNDRENVAVNNNNGGGSSGDNVVAGIISKNSIKRLIDYDNDDETNQENSSKLVKRHKNNCKDFTILSTSNKSHDNNQNNNQSSLESATAIDVTPSTDLTSPIDVTSPSNTAAVDDNGQQSSQKVKRKRITQDQLIDLMSVFEKTDTPSYDVREKLAKKLKMTNREVQVWFQNRRAKANRAKANEHNASQQHHRFLHHHSVTATHHTANGHH
ncbi:11460_t:CDS:2, partial [Entrophospora sp. SA101]